MGFVVCLRPAFLPSMHAVLHLWPPRAARPPGREGLATAGSFCLPLACLSHPVSCLTPPPGPQAEVPLALMIMAAQLVAALIL